jgi:hypothetical protein
VPGNFNAARQSRPRRQQLILEAAIGLADVVQEGDGAEPLDQPFVAAVVPADRRYEAAEGDCIIPRLGGGLRRVT